MSERLDFHVIEPSGPVPAGISATSIQLGIEVKISSDHLRQYLGTRLQPVDVDLLFLAGVVARIDRKVRRRLSEGWARRFHVEMCVHDPHIWNHPTSMTTLVEALGLLTGDHWSFDFRQRQTTEDQILQMSLFPRATSSVATMPYSGGLDSYCGLAVWQAQADTEHLLVHTRNSQSTHLVVDRTLAGNPHRQVSVPIQLPKIGPHLEPTYRARTFTFFIAAAVGASLGSGTEVTVPENGQGALGPALVQFPGEHPYFSTHPLFTRKLSLFLDAIWENKRSVTFLHPMVFLTKGQALSRANHNGGIPAWKSTKSCSRDLARNKGRGLPSQCGVCGGCLLRRVSLHTAGLSPFGAPTEQYLWADLSKSNLEDAICRTGLTTSPNDRRIAAHAVVGMASLADFARTPDEQHSMRTLVEDLRFGLQMDETAAQRQVRSLVRAHHDEWNAALSELPTSAWIRRVAEEMV